MSYFPPPKKPYKYKSLQDVYTESKQSEVVENVQIIGVPEDGTQEQLGAVPDKYYKQLKRLVLSKADGGVESLVKQLLRLGDWPEIADIDTLVLEILLGYDVDVQILNKIVDKKKAGTLGKLESCVNKSSMWNLLDAVDPLAKKLTKNFNSLFQELTHRVQPKIATVSVGPGEISLSMFTNATKSNVSQGETGDLNLNGVGLEIKGDGGRLGSSDYTKGIGKDGGAKYINMLMNRGTGQHFSQAQTPQLRAKIALKAAKAKTQYQRARDVVKKHPDLEEQIRGTYNQLDKNLSDLENTKTTINPELVKNNIQIAFDTAKSYQHPVLSKAVIDNTQSVLKLLEELTNATTDRMDYNWQDSAQYMFNHDWGMTPREMAEAFVEMRTEEMDPGAVASLISAAEKMFKSVDLVKGLQKLKPVQKGMTKTVAQHELQRLQAALQATSYQSAHNFARIVVLNSRTMNASNIKFDAGLDAGGTLRSVYKQLINNPNITVTNAGVDQRNKGIGISVRA